MPVGPALGTDLVVSFDLLEDGEELVGEQDVSACLYLTQSVENVLASQAKHKVAVDGVPLPDRLHPLTNFTGIGLR